MYFGALAAGADCAIGLLAVHFMEQHTAHKIALIFKDFEIRFLKRAEADVQFVCTAGSAIQALVEEAVRTGERVELKIPGHALVLNKKEKTEEERVAEFSLTLSLKKKSPKT